MRSMPVHIKRFEQYIANPKDPNEDETKDPDSDKKPDPDKDDKENDKDNEDEAKDKDGDPIEEMRLYYENLDKTFLYRGRLNNILGK